LSGGSGGAEAGQLSGTRGFDVPGRTPFTANLVCYHWGGGDMARIGDSVLTAIFIPDP